MLADAAKPNGIPILIDLGFSNLHRPFGNDDVCKSRPALFALPNLSHYRIKRKRYLRYQDHVSAARKPRMKCDPARVSSHNLEDHYPVMRSCRRVQPVKCLRRDIDRCHKAER